MFKVMIADDESWIRKGLRAMIDWEGLGLEPDGVASDGMEALQLAEAGMPDILITDVRMPGIDGLRLAEKMLELAPRLKVLIVSGYSDFEYAKTAIRLEAVSYILKPINQSELNETLERAVRKLRAERAEQAMSGHWPGYLERLGADLCRGNGGARAPEEFRDMLKLRQIAARQAAAVLFHYDETDYDADAIEKELALASAAWGRAGGCLVVWERGEKRLKAIALTGEGDSIQDYARYIGWALRKRNVTGIWASIGTPVPLGAAERLSLSYQGALSISEKHAFSRTDDMISYSREEETVPYKYPVQLQKKLSDALIRNDAGSYEGIVREITDYFRSTEGATLKHARSFFLSVVSDAVKLLLTLPSFSEKIVNDGFEFCLRVDGFEDLAKMAVWLREFLAGIAGFMANASQRDVHRSVLLAADYIREHFAEDLSLNAISTRFHVTSSYFSSMFKEVIGENFVEYLTRLRMEQAKTYLTGSAMRIAEIGERVGYVDNRYFSKLFKKHTGLMPSEYRLSSSASSEGENRS